MCHRQWTSDNPIMTHRHPPPLAECVQELCSCESPETQVCDDGGLTLPLPNPFRTKLVHLLQPFLRWMARSLPTGAICAGLCWLSCTPLRFACFTLPLL